MANSCKRRTDRTRKRRVRVRKVWKRIFLLIFVIVLCIITFEVKKLYNNKVIKSVNNNKIQENNIKVGSDKNTVNKETKQVVDTNSVQKENSTSTQIVTSQKRIVKSQSINAEEAFVNDGKKVAFLTFDDGPSTTVTPTVLDILKDYNINGTFFVLGVNIEHNEESKVILKRIYEEGNEIGNHTYSHKLSLIYPHNKVNVDYFMEELDKTNGILREVLGQDFKTRIMRMPGGYMSRVYYRDPNLEVLNSKLKERNMYSIDWNSYDADSDGKWRNAEQLLNEVKLTVASKEKVVVLMHDTYGKEETAKALPQIIEYLKSQGYEFRTLK